MAFNVNALKNTALTNRLTSAQRKVLQDAATEITRLNAAMKNKTTLKNNTVVKAIVKEQLLPLQTENRNLARENKSLKTSLSSEAKLKANPAVKSIVEKETAPLHRSITTLRLEANQLKQKLDLLGKVKRLPEKSFNRFIADAVRDLQTSLHASEPGAEEEFLIRDVEIEASVITEEVNGKPIFSLPTREDLKELSGERLQKLKYSMVLVPRDTEE